MIDPRVFIKRPLSFKKNCKVYPPSVEDVLCNERYPQFLKVLTITQEDIQDDIIKKQEQKDDKQENSSEQKDVKIPTPFEFLLINCFYSPLFLEIVKEAFKFFMHEQITILFEQKIIIIGNLEAELVQIENFDDLIQLNEDNYFYFQNLIRMACGDKVIKPPEPIDPDEDPRVTRIKMKARERDRIKAKRGVTGGISTSTCLVAICCMGIGITPLNIGEMSYAAISPIMQMSQEKEKYDIDIRSLLAGADSKKIKPKYWIRNSD